MVVHSNEKNVKTLKDQANMRPCVTVIIQLNIEYQTDFKYHTAYSKDLSSTFISM